MLKKLALAAVAAVMLTLAVPTQAKAQTIVPDPNACIYTGCSLPPGICYMIMLPCTQVPDSDWEAMYMWLLINYPWVIGYAF